MGFMFCDLHVSLKLPYVGGYKFVEFALLIFAGMPARTRTWSSSHFYSRYITVNLRLIYVRFSGDPTDTPYPPLPFKHFKDFPVRQYAQAACDTEGTSIILCLCSFLEHRSDPSMKSTCAEHHMSW